MTSTSTVFSSHNRQFLGHTFRFLYFTARWTFLCLFFCPPCLSERRSWEVRKLYADDAADIRRERDRTNLDQKGSEVYDLTYPQDGLQARLDGVTTILEVDPGNNRPLVASLTGEATCTNDLGMATKEIRKNCPGVGKYWYR